MSQIVGENTEQALKKLSEDWITAELNGNIAALEKMLTDKFVGVGPRGFMLNKNEWIQRLRSGDLKYESLNWDEVTVRTYDTAAIVTGRETQKLEYQEQLMEGQLRTSLFFVKQQGQWRLAGVQFSPIAGRP